MVVGRINWSCARAKPGTPSRQERRTSGEVVRKLRFKVVPRFKVVLRFQIILRIKFI